MNKLSRLFDKVGTPVPDGGGFNPTPEEAEAGKANARAKIAAQEAEHRRILAVAKDIGRTYVRGSEISGQVPLITPGMVDPSLDPEGGANLDSDSDGMVNQTDMPYDERYRR